ncbi:hypothetical protein HFO93_29405 [Rhizobium leguminosarum]|uniref:Polymer-forming cytoskeletal protein n=1 Tax=Rhizobium leguminosarum TaxID=384 RepID=A0A4Q8XRX0_RHILE|nr:hypothetical protein [Rhizobium leguminosarum]MBY5371113.1 hypothetical protein [Rhizobium leguminosarum]MBY5447488.1 hypothetical protein [Rhizobium leguminosarum]TAX22903.1 hypothetical protein ELI04_33605 [Rhizobium leguminosarum]TAX45738.1 hypothetical protein ELI02_28850 [Rhizobium leguminosarum]TAX46545.1 hypothetical protein ELI01_30710 [Rhizobium leguminosarum]
MVDLDIKIDGSIAFERDVRFFGTITGTVTVRRGRSFELFGVVDHDLVVEPGAVAVVHGIVRGALINKGGDVFVSGVVGTVDDWNELKPTQSLSEAKSKMS